MTDSPRTQSMKTVIEKASPQNANAIEKYVKLRRIHGLKPGTLYNYASALVRFDHYIEGRPFDEATADDVMHFLTDAHEQVSRATVVAYIRLLRKYLSDLHGGELRPGFLPVLTARDPPPPDHANIISREELDALLLACDELSRSTRMHSADRNRALLMLLWDTGLRRAEALSLKFKDVCFHGDDVQLSLDATHPDLKTGARSVWVVDSGPLLRVWMSLHPDPQENSYLFPSTTSPNGRRALGKPGLDKTLKALAKRAGLFQNTTKPLSAHDFRHSAVTRRADAGWIENDLRLFFGWGPTSRMPSRYIHRSLDKLRELARRDSGLGAPVRGAIAATTQTCPMCAEDIKAAALKCKHCGTVLADMGDQQRA